MANEKTIQYNWQFILEFFKTNLTYATKISTTQKNWNYVLQSDLFTYV